MGKQDGVYELRVLLVMYNFTFVFPKTLACWDVQSKQQTDNVSQRAPGPVGA